MIVYIVNDIHRHKCNGIVTIYTIVYISISLLYIVK